MTEENKAGFDKFLTDDAEDGVEYIVPDIELKLSKEKRMECRRVIQEIKSFGITSQRQLLYLVYLLGLEMEDPATMKAITNSCKKARKELKVEKKLILTT